ncbi:hypothetical protein P3875_03840 [Myroides sp. JBRI-B21084]|uniref:hypothetical protein n=1 Tax=Myroides sp. JBRI-B21084 TaxID=3119977 RepID=UPI0026E165F7|nr:hypothetical protein [Paenimyroides cloacae]WKW47203.1 hypothetical protein P3875_03840 [Paenimyroides cloacae]
MFTKKTITYYLFSIFFFLFSLEGFAQCAMCRASLETEETGLKAEAVNDGIVYLMAFPYLLLLIGGVVIYRIMKSKKKSKL